MGKSSLLRDMAPGLGIGAGIGLSSTGGRTVIVCNGSNASSFYCKFVEFFNIFKMFIFIIAFIGLIVWFLYSFSQSSIGRKRGGGIKKMKGG